MDATERDPHAEAPAAYLGVYDADGGLLGDLAYVVGHVVGRAECALCDVTHTWHRKPEWDRMVARLGVPFTLTYRNRVTDASVLAAIRECGLPLVLEQDDAGTWHALLGREELRAAGGSVAAFEQQLRRARAR
ncbi:hypothetical protein GCM10009819_18630 [Agromyces tropicus]|uniref:Uncharacterized protein n=1 Tax=Agromyces tropicus TaxID=555371 RepID=A0ABP5FX95_9MICO